jgi:hypothetical protein
MPVLLDQHHAVDRPQPPRLPRRRPATISRKAPTTMAVVVRIRSTRRIQMRVLRIDPLWKLRRFQTTYLPWLTVPWRQL